MGKRSAIESRSTAQLLGSGDYRGHHVMHAAPHLLLLCESVQDERNTAVILNKQLQSCYMVLWDSRCILQAANSAVLHASLEHRQA
jgi:hypothetical protein